MATSTAALVNNIVGDAEFRTVGSTIAAKLGLLGWVQTADTGQINWTTVTWPLANTTKAGYEIWRMADTLQATAPIYMKISYGRGSSATNFSLWVQFGTGSSGAGALTGTLSTEYQASIGSSDTAGVTSTCYFSGDTNRLCMVLWGNNPTASGARVIVISIERKKDATGADVAGGLYIHVGSATNGISSAPRAEFYDTTSGPFPNTTNWEALMPQNGLGVLGADVGLFPIYLSNGLFLPAGMNMQAYINTAIADFADISATIYGASHTYKAMKHGSSTMYSASKTNSSFLMRWE